VTTVQQKSIERLQSSDKGGGLSRAPGNLKSLSTNFSSGMTDGELDYKREEEIRILKTKEDFYAGASRLLVLVPRLEELSLLHYRMRHGEGEMVNLSKPILEVCLPNLRKLNLLNFCIREAELRHFLSNSHLLESIELNDTVIENGTWQPVFDDLSSRNPPLQKASFSYLYKGRVLEFDKEGVVLSDRWRASITLYRKQIKKSIRYWLKQRRYLGTAEGYRKMDAISRAYGPPLLEY
jgi:hypothetical protein